MLNRVRVQNFKCLRDVDVELGPFTILIGPNDSGKSSFLSCLQLFGMLASLERNQNRQAQRVAGIMRENSWRLSQDVPISIAVESNEPTKFSFSFSVGPAPARQEQKLKVGDVDSTVSIFPNPNPTREPQQMVFRGKKFQPRLELSLLLQLIELEKDDSYADLKQMQQTLEVSEPFRFSPSEMRKPSAATPDPVLSSRGENLAAVVNALLTGPDREAVTELERSLHDAIPTLRGLSTPASDANNGSLRVIKFTLSGTEKPPLTIPASEVSDGAMFLTAFLALIHSQPAQVLLIEEPENGLHPSRLQGVIELLRKLTTGELGYPPRQIILTTHSPVLLNCVTPDEVRIFRRDDEGATQVVRMDQLPDIDRLTKEFAPGELWYLFGEEELVKGPTP